MPSLSPDSVIVKWPEIDNRLVSRKDYSWIIIILCLIYIWIAAFHFHSHFMDKTWLRNLSHWTVLFLYVILFILFLAVLGGFLLRRLFSSCGEQGLLCNWGVWASHPSGFSCCGERALGCMGFSSWGSRILEHGLHCSAECGDLHGSGIKPVSLALADGFFTTEPPGKPWKVLALGCTSWK